MKTWSSNEVLRSSDLNGNFNSLKDGSGMTVAGAADANGWKVVSLGTFKIYTKRVTFSQTIAGGAVLTLSSNNLPVGISSIGNNTLSYSYTATGNAFGLAITFEGSSATSTLNFTTCSNDGISRTYTGFIDVILIAS